MGEKWNPITAQGKILDEAIKKAYKILQLPDLAAKDGTYAISQVDGQMNLVNLREASGNFKLIRSITSDGTNNIVIDKKTNNDPINLDEVMIRLNVPTEALVYDDFSVFCAMYDLDDPDMGTITISGPAIPYGLDPEATLSDYATTQNFMLRASGNKGMWTCDCIMPDGCRLYEQRNKLYPNTIIMFGMPSFGKTRKITKIRFGKFNGIKDPHLIDEIAPTQAPLPDGTEVTVYGIDG